MRRSRASSTIHYHSQLNLITAVPSPHFLFSHLRYRIFTTHIEQFLDGRVHMLNYSIISVLA